MKTNGRKLPVTAGPLVVTLVAAAMAVAGCSSSSSSAAPPKANGAGATASSTATGSARLTQFAQCMRAHGVPDFPDPTAQGTFNVPPSVGNSPQFAPADTACKSLAPPGVLSNQGPTGANLQKATRYAACMRKHGDPSFPDPKPDGKFVGGVSINPNSPQFKAGMSACRTLLPAGSGFGTGN